MDQQQRPLNGGEETGVLLLLGTDSNAISGSGGGLLSDAADCFAP